VVIAESVGGTDQDDVDAVVVPRSTRAFDDGVGRVVAAHRVEGDGQHQEDGWLRRVTGSRGLLDLDGVPALVPTAVGADDVGQLGRIAVGAHAARRRVETPR